MGDKTNPKPKFHITGELTWVRQTEQHHIYLLHWAGRVRGQTIQIPKFSLFHNQSLPTTTPPKTLTFEVREE
jgi:hypothetical protein